MDIIKETINIIRKLRSWLNVVLKNYKQPVPVYPRVTRSGIKVHLGSGEINMQGWINVDARQFSHTHLVSEGFDLKEFTDGSIEELYLCHVLEHFSFSQTETLLINLQKKIAKGGIIRISVPDFDSIIRIYKMNNNNIYAIQAALMGGQGYEYNFHKSLYNKESLTKLIESCGFSQVKDWETKGEFGTDIGDWSSGKFKTLHGLVSISLNLKALNEQQ